MRFSSTLISAAAFFELCIAGYVLEDDYMTDFYENFNFFSGEDPTHGFVDYVDEATARQLNLINASSTATVNFGVDVTNKTPNGRPSIRIESKKKYSSGLIVLDLEHMPFGCGTWPAFWTLGPNWPKGGEIDILEGVNEYTNNGMTLHTGPGCQIGSDTSQFAGSVTTPNCDVAAEDQGKNVGCSIKHPSKNSYGAGLNQNGGGVYATAWNADAISIYFFPRGSIPADVLGDSPDPSAWGKPAAKFAGACDIEEMFAEQKIIIDTTFCGDWAGADDVWEEGSCGKKAKTCNEYVRDNPEAFTEAYWEINALKVYQDDGKPPSTPEYPAAPPPKSTAISVPVPVSSVQASQYPVIPSVSSQVVLPSSSKLASETPSKPTITPAVPLPSSQAPAPVVPTPSRTGRPQGSGRPSRPINTQIRPAPTGLGGMPGWSWPVAADNGGGDDAPVPSLPDTPAQNTTGVPVLPSSRIAIDLPSNVPVAPARPSDAPPAVPDGPPVHTIYHTVYITKTAEPVAATPGPDAAKARMVRHIKDHRRRLTQHHARV